MLDDPFISTIREKIEFHKEQLAVWEAALKSAAGDKARKISGDRGKQPRDSESRKSLASTSPTAFILSTLAAHPGLRAADVRLQAQSIGFNQDNFPYKQLSRLKRIGKVRNEAGRYFLVEKKGIG
jgi:hypothetical protein